MVLSKGIVQPRGLVLQEPDEIVELLRDNNPKALLADGFEKALVGAAYRCGKPMLAVYSVRKAVELLIERDGMSEEEAEEYLEFNSIGAWAGDHTPLWLY